MAEELAIYGEARTIEAEGYTISVVDSVDHNIADIWFQRQCAAIVNNHERVESSTIYELDGRLIGLDGIDIDFEFSTDAEGNIRGITLEVESSDTIDGHDENTTWKPREIIILAD